MHALAYLDCYVSLVYLLCFCLTIVLSLLCTYLVHLPMTITTPIVFYTCRHFKPMPSFPTLSITPACNWYAYLVPWFAKVIYSTILCAPSLLYMHVYTLNPLCQPNKS